MTGKCSVVGCEKKGRRIGRLGDIELIYCSHHEDYGVRVLNFLINSKFRYKFTRFLDETRTDLFAKNEPAFCDKCNKEIAKYVDEKIKELDKDLIDEELEEEEDIPDVPK